MKESIEAENRALAEKAWQADQKHQLSSVFSKSLMNKKLEKASFENYVPQTESNQIAQMICQKYAARFSLNNPQSLMLVGPYGVGKSHLAAAILREVCKKEIIVEKDADRGVVLKTRKIAMLFMSTPKLLTKIRSSFNKESGYTEDALLREIEKVDLLVLDDFGSELKKDHEGRAGSGNDFAIQKIFEIVDGRAGKHTLYTTNYDVDFLNAGYGERNFSRVMEDCTLIQMDGENYRLRGFKK